MPTVLHAGCGTNPLPAWLAEYDETRLDIDPDCEPHIVASMTDMGDVGTFDLVYSSHAIEHLYPDDVTRALREFGRVLRLGGHIVIFVPDLEDVEPTDDPLYDSPAGLICGRDLYYGKASYVALSRFMAHHTGFVRDTLRKAVEAAGFARCEVRRMSGWNLMAVAVKG